MNPERLAKFDALITKCGNIPPGDYLHYEDQDTLFAIAIEMRAEIKESPCWGHIHDDTRVSDLQKRLDDCQRYATSRREQAETERARYAAYVFKVDSLTAELAEYKKIWAGQPGTLNLLLMISKLREALLGESKNALQGPCWCPDHGGWHEDHCNRNRELCKETDPDKEK